MMDFRYPHVNQYGTPQEQISQIKSFLIQHVDKLNNSGVITKDDKELQGLATTVEGFSSRVEEIVTSNDGTLRKVSEIKQTSDEIRAEVSAKVDSSGGSISTFGWSLDAYGFYLYSNYKTVMVANNAGISVNGTINADSGLIGNSWHIEDWGIWSGADGGNKTVLQTGLHGSGYWMIATGGSSLEDMSSYRFRVNRNGYAVIEDGVLGNADTGWAIDASSLYCTNSSGYYVRISAQGVRIGGEAGESTSRFATWNDIVAVANAARSINEKGV